jgi:cytochrome c oxidase subunit 2
MKLLALGFQDPASPIMEGIIDLHNHIMFYLVLILVFVLYMFFSILRDFYQPYTNPETLDDLKLRQILLKGNAVVHGTLLEIIWTLTPSFILMLIAVPSFSLLYSMDEIIDPSLTLKAVGHQWYWSYEYSDYIQTKGSPLNFDSYLLPYRRA